MPLDGAIAADPSQPSAWGYRGNAYATQGKLSEAAADFTRALALNPADAAATRGLTYVKQQQQLRMAPPK